MYRPKDWNNPHEIEYKPGINSAVDVAEGIAFEAGADAMLEALRKGGRCLEDGQLVFIPADTP